MGTTGRGVTDVFLRVCSELESLKASWPVFCLISSPPAPLYRRANRLRDAVFFQVTHPGDGRTKVWKRRCVWLQSLPLSHLPVWSLDQCHVGITWERVSSADDHTLPQTRWSSSSEVDSSSLCFSKLSRWLWWKFENCRLMYQMYEHGQGQRI